MKPIVQWYWSPVILEAWNRVPRMYINRFQQEIKKFNMEDEISLTMVGDVGRNDAAPLVIVYPEAVIYGPVKPEDVPFIVEEHLYKGRIATELQAPGKRSFRSDCLAFCP